MPRFVLLRHQCPPEYEKPSHWDLMLEQGGQLQTWEMRELPSAWALELGAPKTSISEAVTAIRLPDHRLAYLDYEGPLSDKRGNVRRCDCGLYEVQHQDEKSIVFSLRGATLRCKVTLNRDAAEWRLSAST